MRVVLVGAAAAVLVAAFGGAADGRQPEKIDGRLLVGRWTPRDVPKGDDFLAEFTKDGKVTMSFKGKDEKAVGTYKLDGDKLTLKLKLGDKEKTMTRTVHLLTRAELVSSDEGGTKDTLVRWPEKKGK